MVLEEVSESISISKEGVEGVLGNSAEGVVGGGEDGECSWKGEEQFIRMSQNSY